jgi:TolB-like protein/tetratricopeptide (TPR) repeat protein
VRTVGGQYVIERELGGGGMSRVYAAMDSSLGRRVVVKMLPAEMSGQFSVDRFRREISIAARLQHAYVVPLLSAGEDHGVPYFTMPFVEGESLRVRLGRPPTLTLAESVRILREVASALAYAHAHDVVHRDIKPDNVLLSGGVAMVTDFGVAKAVDAAMNQPTSELITSIGVTLGTPAYMAPEQVSGDPLLDHRADLYSWGAMAYEMLAGQVPFAGRTAGAMLAAHANEAPVPVSQRCPGVPPVLADLVMRCLEKRAADRPQRAEDLVQALDTLGSTPSGAATSAPRAAAFRGRGRRVLIAGAAVVIIGSGLWLAVRFVPSRAARSTGPLSLAVLPIENIGGEASRDYLADGMTGELAGALRKTPGLQVAGDLSTSRFKSARATPSEMARQLGVGMLLTGKLQSQGGRIRLQMQLVDANGTLLWSDTFDRDAKDNFVLQDEITAAVTSEMRLVLSPDTVAAERAGRTQNPEAHDLFMRGQFEKNRLSEQGLSRGLGYFQQAIALDPNYAQAHVGVAVVYDLLADVFAPSHETHALAKAAAERALRADHLLAEAHVLYGYEVAATDWDFAAGRAEMERGLAMNPNSPDALFMYSLFLGITGDTPRAVETADRLIQLDRLSATASFAREEALAFGGRYTEALQQDAITKKLDPTVVYGEAMDGWSLRELGRFDEAVTAYEAFQKLIGQPSFGLAITYGRMGKRDEALGVIRALEDRERKQWVDPVFIACAYDSLPDRDAAMRWLEKGFQEKAFSLRFLLSWSDTPLLRNLRTDPRFPPFRQRVLTTIFKE